MNSTTKIIADQTDSYVSLFHSYDSKKEGGATVSHLRFGPQQITSEYLIDSDADFITCTKEPFVRKYHLLKSLKDHGTFLLNTPDKDIEGLEKYLPSHLLRDIANKHAKFFIIDAG
jgi:pyruvate-ferredoxin/flavodoxin oxidoreductase